MSNFTVFRARITYINTTCAKKLHFPRFDSAVDRLAKNRFVLLK